MSGGEILVADVSWITGPVGVGSAILVGAEWQMLADAHGFRGVRVYVPSHYSDAETCGQIWSSLQGVEVTREPVPEQAFWPDVAYQKSVVDLDTTLRLQGLYSERGVRPSLRFQEDIAQRARQWVSQYAGGKFSVALHLKQVSQDSLESNAALEEWRSFLSTEEPSIQFFLLGQDDLRGVFEGVPGVKGPLGLPLIEELAIIQACDAFMGMSSGLCNVAIMSDKPYTIFKHPDHHAKKMKHELRDGNSFSFSIPGQSFLRQVTDQDTLHYFFNFMVLSL